MTLEHHGRYEYRNIDQRPTYEWPNGTRLAVFVAMNVEVFRFGKGKGAAIAPPDQAQSPSIYSYRDYGNRVGFWRLMDMFREMNIPLEHQLNTAAYDLHPDIVERIRAHGDEILGHGHTNSDEQAAVSVEEERALIEQCTARITKEEGHAPTGWMSPWFSNSDQTLDLLQEAGYKYVMDWTSDDQPIWAKTRNGKILLMPYPIESNDNRALVWFRYSSKEYADMLIDAFDEMLEQSKRQPLVCPIALHPFVVGRPYRLPQLRRVFEHIQKHRDQIWLTRPGDIYRHVASLPPGTVPGDQY
ncbi:polysaccharide deacetylase family protein [Bordetella sp. 02P26C-1]|uniref:polysaccharide deacetylase family protein n=1 Tax=Bordetella sp. 02P26C-1 TaxID=2683195 RepID=UPI001355ED0A|nr:polysaccharide deacetylase family protein [Bordetella sp. 02P26C-1]MVW77986.1 polysaccharide deacetylase family protein [Bordetella sp. 02P26C-1]